ncbi:hypothetical protein [Saccharococcus caldoxylosilyticus]|uniref:hypothetical protein n=1 Tax=Saccharococcus caldoxylosilyticus TaxID=81408 RepID=UPI001FCB3DE4|nr:hypothetical protein [Parageobacillus caldoxylosilyticus]BDG45437.1 hypothetical protein PcaKH35_37820 [Parageobacillus caldoxylosilyticus]
MIVLEKERAAVGLAPNSGNANYPNYPASIVPRGEVTVNPVDWLRWLHGENFDKQKGAYITLASKRPEYKQHTYHVSKIISHLDEWMGDNTYALVNTAGSASRKADNIKLYNANFAELDTLKMGIDPAEVAQDLASGKFGLPIPSGVLYSGRGLHVYWLIEPIFADMEELVFKWRQVQYALCDILADVGADPNATDAARVMRLAGSTHPLVPGFVATLDIWSRQRYKVYDLWASLPTTEISALYLDATTTERVGDKSKGKSPHAKTKWVRYRKKPTEARTAATGARTRAATRGTNGGGVSIKLITEMRLQDFYTIAAMRQGVGHRAYLLHAFALLAYWYNPDRAQDIALDFNARALCPPLPRREAIKYIESAEERRRKGKKPYSDPWIIDKFQLTPEELEKLTIIKSDEKRLEIDRERKMRKRREQGVKPREQYEVERQAQQAEKLAILRRALEITPNATNKQLADALGLSVRQIQRLKKLL